MITVHHLNHSRSQRVLWLLEELQLPYEIRRYRRDAKTMLAPPELKAAHPLGKAPVIDDDGVVVAESGAIIEYLVDKAGGALRPPAGSAAQRRYSYWLHFAEGSAMPMLLLKLVFDRVRNAPMPFFARPIARGIADKVDAGFITPNLRSHLEFMETELADRPWFAGDAFTAADVQMSFPVEAAAARGGLDSRYPRLADWLARIHARSAYRRALERGGPYTVLSAV